MGFQIASRLAFRIAATFGVFVSIAFSMTRAEAQIMSTTTYDMGSPTVQDIWVDPLNGNNANSGSARDSAVRTLEEAWNRTPLHATFSNGYRIVLTAGDYPEDTIPVYFDGRWGTFEHPLIIQAIDGRGTANLLGDMNVFDTRYLYMIDFDITPNPPGDAFHCEQCSHILIRGMEMNGGAGHEAHETIKMNQSQYVYIEDSNIYNTYENAIDFVSVQYGHIVRNKLHDGDDWCIYLKGGSAYFLVEGNEIYNCGTGGFSTGQGTGFNYMQTPWLHYETYDVKFVNNVIHHTQGAGFGVNGGYNILLAHNTLYHVGANSHLIEVVHGGRSCDEHPERCASNNAAGGWGPTYVTTVDHQIPDRNVYIYNNIVYNPAGFQSAWVHFSVHGPAIPPTGANIPNPSLSDTNLRIRGNIIYNGTTGMPLGVGEGDTGCQPSNPTCNPDQLRADNAINTIVPQLANPEAGDFRPIAGGNVFSATTYEIPAFPGGDRETSPQAPEGLLSNSVPRDYSGTARIAASTAGAYSGVNIPRAPGDDYLQWNSFLAMTNILELTNPNSTSVTATITVWNNLGNAIAQTNIRLDPSQQRDIILNDLTGFLPDSYGLVTLNYLGGYLRGRMSFYRRDDVNPNEFAFAYASSITPPLTGESFVNYNTYFPAKGLLELSYLTSNWLGIVNISTTDTLSVRITRYDSAGNDLGFEDRSIAPFGRLDLASNIAGGDKIGLVRITPTNSLHEYFASNVRYGSSQLGSGYKYAFPLLAKNASVSEVYLPVSTGGGATNFIEVSNLTDFELSGTVTIYDAGGLELGAAQSIRLGAHGQQHIYVGYLLPRGASGMARILTSQMISAYSMYYFYDSLTRLSAMYGVSYWTPGTCNPSSGSYNLFLGMYNWLKLFNPTNIEQRGTIRVTPPGQSPTVHEVVLPPYGARDLGLHQSADFGTSPNTYGMVELSGATICGEILRIKPTDSGEFDFVFPTTME